jgi:2-dehydro-3-deoxyphosphogluconate aldolase/(4S)-4-hydroxy-2-oxoglutarate aldolase
MQEVSQIIATARLLPVVVIDDEHAALPLAAALKEGGLRCVEITLRTPAAHLALRAMAGDPELTVGAGTVLDLNQLDSALEAGAQYIVTPGFSPRIVQQSSDRTALSSKSTGTSPSSPGSATRGASPARFTRSRDATASSWRTCPKVNERRNDPNVDGA